MSCYNHFRDRPVEARMSMDIEYTVQIWEEDDQFIAHAMPLDVVSSGNTADEARAAVNEAVQLFLLTAKEAGTLEEIRREAGYRGTSYTRRVEKGYWSKTSNQ
jgi:predicted RNase H-like HicB family nuclease